MNYTKQYINKLGEETNFINSNLEKVVRLLDVLDYIFTNSSFSNDVVLKGGTAINLVHTNLKRLSVDINLDYQGSLERKKAFVDKEKIANELDGYMSNTDIAFLLNQEEESLCSQECINTLMHSGMSIILKWK